MYKVVTSLLFTALFLFSALNSSYSQTCSCAGAPLLGAQSNGASGQGNLLVGLTYEFNQITNLYTGSQRITNDSAERNTQSTLLEVNYGLTDRLSLTGTFSYVRKERTSGIRSPSGTQTSSTSGIGDGLFLIRYTLLPQTLWNRYHIAIGAGSKAPLGSTSVFNTNGLRFNADMQPGTGAWDGVLWSNMGISFLPHSTGNLSLTTSYRRTGTNQRFTENDDYQFGNELITNLGFSNNITNRIAYTLNFRYRSTSSDFRNNSKQPNTGGFWFTFLPDLHISLSEKTSLMLSGQLPLHQQLNGLQPSTTYALSASFFINLNSSKNTFIHANR